MRVLLIHGRAQGGKDAVALKQQWIEALGEGFEAAKRPWPTDVDFDFPYYGDALDKFVDNAALRDPADVAEKGPGQQPQFELFMQAVLTEIQNTNPSLDEASIRSEFPSAPIGEKGPQNWSWLHAIARFIDNRWIGATNFTIERFLKDVFLYVSNRHIAKQIDQIVLDMLTDQPTVVLGHSLGSVVSYNIIRAPNTRLNVVKHITVGSPLGLKSISSRLGIPANTATNGWFNAFDPDDIVALQPLDATRFAATPAVENYGGVDNQTSNQHGIAGYLNDGRVAASVADAIGA